MPTEVLGEIFSWTLRSKVSEALDAGRFDMERSPWLLTQISSRWRAVSLSTPSLWSRIAIDYSAESAHYSLALVKTQIERTKALRIHFYACSRTESVPQSQMWELLSQHSLRWEELSVGITWDMLSSLPALHDRLSSLKRLWIQWEGPENPTTVPSIDCFQSTPSLVEFAVNTFIPVAVGLHQLTRYQFVAPWLAHRCMLEQTWNLVEAYIINFDDEPWPEIGSIINLPSLRRLHLSDPKILNYLRAPSLEGLFFWVSRGEPPDILVESFLDRCACPLRRLGLSGFPDAHTTTQMLQKFPSITELVIVLDDDDARTEIDSLISTLTVTGSVSGSSAVVAPQLSSLFFGCEDDNNINYQMFLRMLKSRWEAEDCALKNAALVTGCCGPDPATLGALCALRQEGLDLLLRSGVEASEEINGWLYATTWN
ncbi:hypothetical protein K438DRAFT_1808620 [Mycena galopus ATCC 62051]|nr:hypothetical protein K438DRAFT_1808620 [Mycena galopus ATCC 62051]